MIRGNTAGIVIRGDTAGEVIRGAILYCRGNDKGYTTVVVMSGGILLE